MIIKKSILGLGSALVLAMLVSGCGGNGDDNRFDRSGSNNTGEPVAAQDAFIDAVKGVVATTSDTTEAGPIDSITPTGRNDTAPVQII
ncbi:MAG: hypothetical protein HHJ09_03420 [Glaciimonas sp.]|nr:hypothetical protein [Glaciimonas sp.]